MKTLKEVFGDTFTKSLTKKDEALLQRRLDLVEDRISIYRREREMEVEHELLVKKTEGLKQLGEYEHEFHYSKEVKKTEIAKLQVELENLNNLIEIKAEQLGKELDYEKRANEKILAEKNKTIELLTSQVEILTAKLTEIKISDVHLHTEATLTSK